MTEIVNLKDIDYCIIGCGYVERLIQYMDEIKEDVCWMEWSRPLFLGTKPPTYWPDVTASERAILNNIKDHKSGVCFKLLGFGRHVGQCLDIANRLMQFNHCAMFSMANLYQMSFIDTSIGRVCVLDFDTESG